MDGLERIDELLKKYGQKTTFELLEMLDAAHKDTFRLNQLQSLLNCGSVNMEQGINIRLRLDECGTEALCNLLDTAREIEEDEEKDK